MTAAASTRRLTVVLVAMMAILTIFPVLGSGAAAEAAPRTREAHLDGLPAGAGVQQADGARRSEPVETPIAFSMVGFEIPRGADVEFRTSTDGARWEEWTEAEVSHDGPDPGSDEAARENKRASDGYWVGEARFLQVRVDGATPDDVPATLIDSAGLSAGLVDRVAATLSRPWIDMAPAEAATKPRFVTREQWDPNGECKPRRGASYAATAHRAIVHHTAGSNNYSDGKAVVRGICRYHVYSNGWNDIGYNILVDKWGTVYEGRRGGLDRAVIGAHAAGHNTGSIGISVMGNFETASPSSAVLHAISRTLAWKFQLHEITPSSSTIIGHRDVGSTSCPGRNLYSERWTIRNQTANKMGISFSDIRWNHHRDNINRIASHGVTDGCGGGKYCPDQKVERDQMASFLRRAKVLRPRWGQVFADVPAGHVQAPDIRAIVDADITNGCTSDRYCPNRGVSRAEMASFLARALGLEGQPGNRFTDVKWSSKHRENINALADAGVTQGCNKSSTRFCPDQVVPRDQMASFIARALDEGLR